MRAQDMGGAVLKGSEIWEGEWLEQRADTQVTDKEGPEEMYRQRSIPKPPSRH